MGRGGKGRESKNNGTQKELEWRYLTWVGTKRGCWRLGRAAAGCLEGLSREQRGVVFACYDRGAKGCQDWWGPVVGCLPSPTGMTDAGGQVTLGRADGKKVLGPLVPRNPTCASVAARHPLWAPEIDSLHHGTADSRPFVDALSSLSASGGRLSGLGRLRADSSTSTLFSHSRHALCHWAECDRPSSPP